MHSSPHWEQKQKVTNDLPPIALALFEINPLWYVDNSKNPTDKYQEEQQLLRNKRWTIKPGILMKPEVSWP